MSFELETKSGMSSSWTRELTDVLILYNLAWAHHHNTALIWYGGEGARPLGEMREWKASELTLLALLCTVHPKQPNSPGNVEASMIVDSLSFPFHIWPRDSPFHAPIP